jgi:hypothetical protein
MLLLYRVKEASRYNAKGFTLCSSSREVTADYCVSTTVQAYLSLSCMFLTSAPMPPLHPTVCSATLSNWPAACATGSAKFRKFIPQLFLEHASCRRDYHVTTSPENLFSLDQRINLQETAVKAQSPSYCTVDTAANQNEANPSFQARFKPKC